jgi:prepilin-type processing-associated H-X9-DG protein
MSEPSAIPQPAATQPSKTGRKLTPLVLIGCGALLLIFIVLGSLMLGLLMPALAKARESARRVKSGAQMREIVVSMGVNPQETATLLGSAEPDLEGLLPPFLQWESPLSQVGGETSYIFLAPSIGAALPDGAKTPLLMENPNIVDANGLNVAYGDGHVVWEQRADAFKMLERHGSRVFQTNGRPWRRTSAEP